MSRTRVIIPFTGSRGAAKSKLEVYLTDKEFKRQVVQKGAVIWHLDMERLASVMCIYFTYDSDKISLSAWIAGNSLLGDKDIGELDISSFPLRKFIPRMRLRRIVNGIEKLYE
ncbi:MAG: hypothetical protein LIO56_04675 [Lachnospiraceae bacterium]|nr:hypothetical protein [Lachnospiraceae bacterium]